MTLEFLSNPYQNVLHSVKDYQGPVPLQGDRVSFYAAEGWRSFIVITTAWEFGLHGVLVRQVVEPA